MKIVLLRFINNNFLLLPANGMKSAPWTEYAFGQAGGWFWAKTKLNKEQIINIFFIMSVTSDFFKFRTKTEALEQKQCWKKWFLEVEEQEILGVIDKVIQRWSK